MRSRPIVAWTGPVDRLPLLGAIRIVSDGSGLDRFPLSTGEGRKHPWKGDPMYVLIAYLRAKLMSEDEGATAVEYGMLVALIAAVIVASVVALGTQINTAFGTVTGQF
jgi:pilus assembly protein Flp/PilA